MIVESIREQVHGAGGILDCHLMVERPERQIEQFAAAGADSITIQAEATPNVHFALQQIRDAGCLAGLAINPGTPVEAVAEVVDLLDLVLCMTVNPGSAARRSSRPRPTRSAGCATWSGRTFRSRSTASAPSPQPPCGTPGRRCSSRARRSSASPTRRRHRAIAEAAGA